MSDTDEIKILKVLLYGYCGSGKTTALAAAVSDTRVNGARAVISVIPFNADLISEDGTKNDHDRLTQQCKELESHSPTSATEIHDWYHYELVFSFANAGTYRVQTVDYSGKLTCPDYNADGVLKDRHRDLMSYLAGCHALYLVFDGAAVAESVAAKDRQTAFVGLSYGLQWALDRFSKERTNFPIIVLVTKADLLFPNEKKDTTVASKIIRLNSNQRIAQRKLRELYGDKAAQVLLQRENPVTVYYLAALGARPYARFRDATGVAVSDPAPGAETAYVIPSDWGPVGFRQAFAQSLAAAWEAKKKKEIGLNPTPRIGCLTKIILALFLLGLVCLAVYFKGV